MYTLFSNSNIYAQFEVKFFEIGKSIDTLNFLKENNKYVIKIKFHTYNSKNENLNSDQKYNLCLFSGYFFYNDTRFYYFKKEKMKYNSIEKSFISDTFEIPLNSTLFYYQLYESNIKINNFQFIPVVNESNNFNKGVSEYYLTNIDSAHFMDYFNLERRIYPDNINVFPLKWINLIQYQIGTQQDIKNVIKTDLEIIDKIETNLQNKKIIKYIGYYLLKDTTNMLKYAIDISNLENIPILNNYFISDLLLNLLIKDRNYKDISQDSIFFKIMINNPESMFIESIVKGGLLYDLYPSKSPQAVTVLNLFTKKDKKNLLSISEKIAFAYYLVFSKDTNNNILGVNQIKNILNEYFNTDYCNRNDDPLNHLYLKRSMLFNLATIAFNRNHLFEQGIELQNYILEKYKPSDFEFQDAAFYKALFFQQKGNLDSVFYWYAVSYKLNSTLKVYNEIKKSLNEKYKYSDDYYKKWFDSVVNSFNYDFIKVENYSGPPLKSINGDTLGITKGKYLLEFYSKNCTFCRINLMSLNKYSSEYFTSNNIKVVIVTDIPANELNEEFANLLFPYKLLQNSNDIISYFNVTEYPVTLFLDKGIIIKRINGGNKNGLNLAEFLE